MKKKTLSVCFGVACASTLVLTGCTTKTVKYNPNDFVNPNKIVEKRVDVPAFPNPQVKASFGIGNDPNVLKAYNQYLKTGVAKTITDENYITYPYTPYAKPVLNCQPLRICVVQLEPGELVKGISIGDQQHWKVGEMTYGSGQDTTTVITIKPIKYDISTDLYITTDRRLYSIGLVSSHQDKVRVLRFYYPNETRAESILNAQKQQMAALQSGGNPTVVSSGPATHINVNHMNFNYTIQGAQTPWRPLRVFDDGNKTFIEMPSAISHTTMPVLYLARGDKRALVNYRYEKPYLVVDMLFSRAWLISGNPKQGQQMVEIINHSMDE
jgi:type IV secretion system protein VirB9